MSRAIHVFRTPDRFVAGTVGQPGNRTFYLQAVHDTRVVSVILEKAQVAVLAERIAALLLEINRRFGTPIPPDTGDVDDLSPLITPVDAEFRVGTMGLGWDSEAQTVVVELLAVSETEFDASVVLDDAEEGPDAVRVFLTPESAREFATRSNRVISDKTSLDRSDIGLFAAGEERESFTSVNRRAGNLKQLKNVFVAVS